MEPIDVDVTLDGNYNSLTDDIIPEEKLDDLFRTIQNDPTALQRLSKNGYWCAPLWKKWYDYYAHNKDNEALRTMRRLVWKTTKAICDRNHYLYDERTTNEGPPLWRTVRLEADWPTQSRQTKFYDWTASSPHLLKADLLQHFPHQNNHSSSLKVQTGRAPKPTAPTEIYVVSEDCLEVGLYLKNKLSLNPVILNMASPRQPGGGYKTGAAAQEENLFRRSSYYVSLVDPAGADESRTWGYPLPEFCAVYSPSVAVFRKSEARGYGLMREPQSVSFLAVAAYRAPALVPGTPKHPEPSLEPRMAEKVFFKAYQILYVAMMEGHDSVVLSALGCGAYGNPPGHIAKIFHKVIHLPEFRGAFRNISFAILDDGNAFKKHNPKGNLSPFRRIFSTSPQYESYDLRDLYGDEMLGECLQKDKKEVCDTKKLEEMNTNASIHKESQSKPETDTTLPYCYKTSLPLQPNTTHKTPSEKPTTLPKTNKTTPPSNTPHLKTTSQGPSPQAQSNSKRNK